MNQMIQKGADGKEYPRCCSKWRATGTCDNQQVHGKPCIFRHITQKEYDQELTALEAKAKKAG